MRCTLLTTETEHGLKRSGYSYGLCLFIHFIGGPKLARGTTSGCPNQSGGPILAGGQKFQVCYRFTLDFQHLARPLFFTLGQERGVRHSVKSRTPWLKSILKSRNQKPAEIRNHFLSQNYSAKSLKLLQSKK